jgi:hypothetical protein
MDEEGRNVQEGETAEPDKDENDSEYEVHGWPLS